MRGEHGSSSSVSHYLVAALARLETHALTPEPSLELAVFHRPILVPVAGQHSNIFVACKNKHLRGIGPPANGGFRVACPSTSPLRGCAQVIGSGRLCAGQADWSGCAQRGRVGTGDLRAQRKTPPKRGFSYCRRISGALSGSPAARTHRVDPSPRRGGGQLRNPCRPCRPCHRPCRHRRGCDLPSSAVRRRSPRW